MKIQELRNRRTKADEYETAEAIAGRCHKCVCEREREKEI